MTDRSLFAKAKEQMLGKMQGERGIGTLSEKSVHSVLKFYYAPDEKYHEVKVGSHVADTCVDGEIHEIQTRQFYRLNDKLEEFLNTWEMEVTIVYPVSVINTINWINPETGEVSRSRTTKTPKKIYKVFRELYGIREYLDNPRLHLIIAELSTEDYRLLDGFGKEKKSRATKTDKVPTELLEERKFESLTDVVTLLPDTLPDEFTAKEFARLSALGPNDASVALLLLYRLGTVEREKKDRAYIYRLKSRNLP